MEYAPLLKVCRKQSASSSSEEDFHIRVIMPAKQPAVGERDTLTNAQNYGIRGCGRKAWSRLGDGVRWMQLKLGLRKLREPRTIYFGKTSLNVTPTTCAKYNPIKRKPPAAPKFPVNAINNRKYNVFTFLPLVLYSNFCSFVNLYLLVLACTQFFAPLQVGPIYTYWGPLCFVIGLSMLRELVQDIIRLLRDKEINSTKYNRLSAMGMMRIRSEDIRVGDVIEVRKNDRIPADMVLLRTSERSGSCFIRTDQLDGETDWKLKIAVCTTQELVADTDLFNHFYRLTAEQPRLDLTTFCGKFERILPDRDQGVPDLIESTDYYQELAEQRRNRRQRYSVPMAPLQRALSTNAESLSLQNVIWASTVLANGTALGLVVYTGTETRSTMNTSEGRIKSSQFFSKLNKFVAILFLFMFALSVSMVVLKGITDDWFRYFVRYAVLFASIIPGSIIVNMEFANAALSWLSTRDRQMPGANVRCINIPQELGRVQLLLSDKTGTLTKNEMVMKKLHMGSAAYSEDTFADLRDTLRRQMSVLYPGSPGSDHWGGIGGDSSAFPLVRLMGEKLVDIMLAIALCHNVTPVYDNADEQLSLEVLGRFDSLFADYHDADSPIQQRFEDLNQLVPSYQASSPDEVALVKWTESVGLTLVKRDINEIWLRCPESAFLLKYRILNIFPFTSETKRMGIIVENVMTRRVELLIKGADTVMTSIVQYNDWLEEECDNMARDGLRTLVFGRKVLSQQQYAEFQARYRAATLTLQERSANVLAAQESLERDLELLCVTGVEDRLQDDVRNTLETLRNAGIRLWMLTGDKMETAVNIAKSSCLIGKTQSVYEFVDVQTRQEAHQELNVLRRNAENVLVVSGQSLAVCRQFYEQEFVELSVQCPAVVVYRCSPTQKAMIATMMKVYAHLSVAAIGDGGNDVSMIQCADIGVGIEGKEGKQAALAADYSLTQFKHVARLFLVHGRYNYLNSAALCFFTMHRGIILSTIQAIYSVVFYFVSVQMFPSILLVGYSTFFTTLPVFSLIMDRDVRDDLCMNYPEIYKELVKGRAFSFKVFFMWMAVSVFQGAVIMFLMLLFFENEFYHVITIVFTALLFTEWINILMTMHICSIFVFGAELISLLFYVLALFIFRNAYFDTQFMLEPMFYLKVIAITALSCIPLYIIKFLRKQVAPAVHQKLTP